MISYFFLEAIPESLYVFPKSKINQPATEFYESLFEKYFTSYRCAPESAAKSIDVSLQRTGDPASVISSRANPHSVSAEHCD